MAVPPRLQKQQPESAGGGGGPWKVYLAKWFLLTAGMAMLLMTMESFLRVLPHVHVTVQVKKQQQRASPPPKRSFATTTRAAAPMNHQHPLLRFKRGEISLEEVPNLPVAVWPYLELGTKTAASIHIEEAGIAESSKLHHATSLYDFQDPNVIWLADMGYPFKKKPRKWCRRYFRLVKQAQRQRQLRGLPTKWPILILAFGDDPELNRCYNIEKAVGTEYVFYSIRSIVEGRHYNRRKQWIEFGHLLEMKANGKKFTHAPLIVRTDIVQNVQDVLQETYKLDLTASIETLPRQVSVAHYWPIDSKKEELWSGESELRHRVSVVLEQMKKSHNLDVFVGLAGEGHAAGRNGVQSIYVESLLNTKIVVVTQRDAYEDHYRLFEALVTGSMVLTDQMLSLPEGLEEGVSVVQFTSAQDLRDKILYYLVHEKERLAIAKQGRYIAMSRHRAWHRMEEIVFGTSITTCNNQRHGSPCPFIVHANETRK